MWSCDHFGGLHTYTPNHQLRQQLGGSREHLEEQVQHHSSQREGKVFVLLHRSVHVCHFGHGALNCNDTINIDRTAQHSTAQQGMARHSTARHSTAQGVEWSHVSTRGETASDHRLQRHRRRQIVPSVSPYTPKVVVAKTAVGGAAYRHTASLKCRPQGWQEAV